MRRTGKSKYELAHSKNPLTRKRALFAINASHWKHDEGGHLFLGDNSYLLTLFDKYSPNSLVIQIDKPVRLNEVQVVADAPKPGDKNYDRYIANTYDAWKRGDVDINTLPTETRNRVRGYSGTIAALKGMDTAAKVAGITSAIPAGIIGGISFAPTAWSIMNNPIIDAILTTHGAITAPKNIKEGVQELQEGNYGRGALDLGLTALDLYGTGKLAKHGKNALNRAAETVIRMNAYPTRNMTDMLKSLNRNKEYIFLKKNPRFGDYNGIITDSNIDVPLENDVVSAYVYGNLLDPKLGKFLGYDEALYGPHADYINKYYKRKKGKIPVYELNFPDLNDYKVRKALELALDMNKPIGFTGDMQSLFPYAYINTGGHIAAPQLSKLNKENIDNVIEQDIWKFNYDDYNKRWSGIVGNLNLMNRLGIKVLDKIGTPIIFKSKPLDARTVRNSKLKFEKYIMENPFLIDE